MNTPRFSIIMPCYNSEAYVVKAIESVVNQTYPFWELIVINDGSYDNTLNIVNSYAVAEKRIKVFSKENGGYATAVNYGLDHVNGDYFLFLGSDDCLDIHLFENLSNAFNEYALLPDMVAFRTRLVAEDGTVEKPDPYTAFEEPLLTRATFKEFNLTNSKYSSIFSVRDTSRCYKTELLGDTRYFGKTGLDADGIFSMLLSHKANTFLNLPVDGYLWYLRKDSVSASVSLTKQIDRISNWHHFFDIVSDVYKDDLTPIEKQYLLVQIGYIVKLSAVPARALKYWSFIREEANYAIKIAKKLDVTCVWHIKVVSKTPLLYALSHSLYSAVKRAFRQNR